MARQPVAESPAGRRTGLHIVDLTEFYSERGGGIRSHLTHRGRYLASQAHRHCLIAPGSRDHESVELANASDGRAGATHVVRLAGPSLPYDRTYHLFHRFGDVRRRVRDERPDVLEVHSPYLAAAAALACGAGAARLRTTFWHSDHIRVHVEPALGAAVGARAARPLVRPLWEVVRALLSPFDATFVAGRSQAAHLRSLGVPRVFHVPFGVDKRVFCPSARSPGWREHHLVGLPRGALLLVGAGRFAQEKRWDIVLDAFARLQRTHAATLVLFGDGPERERLRLRAPPGVVFPGFEQDRGKLAMAFASADALVHAGPYETFGLGVAEAIACGTPIVVPDKGGAAEHAELAGSEIYRSLDVDACAAAILRLLGRSASELRAQSLEAAGRARSIEQHFAQVLAVYGDLLEQRRPLRGT